MLLISNFSEFENGCSNLVIMTYIKSPLEIYTGIKRELRPEKNSIKYIHIDIIDDANHIFTKPIMSKSTIFSLIEKYKNVKKDDAETDENPIDAPINKSDMATFTARAIMPEYRKKNVLLIEAIACPITFDETKKADVIIIIDKGRDPYI